jgi:DNA repair exonuclease SbcCD ATPase subunit
MKVMRTETGANSVNAKLKNIYHVSDIHIKKILHKDIINAFSLIVKTISDSRETSGTILVIAGDVFENKNTISQHDAKCFQNILKMLIQANITTIIIPGNHDFVRTNDLDLITPLVMHEDGTPIFNNIYCYAKSGVYKHMGVEFHVLSPVDKIIPQIEKNNHTKIAIVHETINGINTYQKHFTTGCRLGLNDFTVYDYVLLGDIHKYQSFGGNIAYCGSLVQKDRGEDLVHGYIKWDLEKKTHSFVPLPIYSGYIDINISDNNDVKDTDMPNIIAKEINVNYQRCTDEFNAKLFAKISAKYDKINIDENKNKIPFIIRFNNHNIQTMTDSTSNNKIVIGGEEILRENLNLNTLDNQLQIITAYLKDIGKNDIIGKIIELHKSKAEQQIIYKRWKLNWLKWSNISCYSTDNYINFDEIDGIASILGKNKTGKSSIITALLFCLTENTGRISTTVIDDIINKHVLNKFQGKSNSKNNIEQINAIIECGFTIDNIKYLVHVNIKESNKNYILQNGTQITYNKEQTFATLKSLVNSIAIFNMVTIKGQDVYTIADIKDTTLVKQFDAITGSDALNAILLKAKSQLTKLQNEIDLDDSILKKMFSGSEENYKANSSELIVLTDKINELNTKIKKYDSLRINLIKSIPKIYDYMTNEEILADIENFNQKLLKFSTDTKDIPDDENMEKIFKLKTKYVNLLDELNDKYNNLLRNSVEKPKYNENMEDAAENSVKLTKEELIKKINFCKSNIYPLCDIKYKKLNMTKIQLKIEELEKQYMDYFEIDSADKIDYSIKKINDDDMKFKNIEISDEYVTDYIPNLKHYSEQLEKYTSLYIKYKNNRKKIDELKEQIAHATKKHSELEYNSECSSCTKNSHHFSTLYKINELNDNLVKLQKTDEKYTSINNKYKELKHIVSTTPEQLRIYKIQRDITHNEFIKPLLQLKSDFNQLQSEKYRNEQIKYEYMLENVYYSENIEKYNNYIAELKNLETTKKTYKEKIAVNTNRLEKYKLSSQITLAKKAIEDKKKLDKVENILSLLKPELLSLQQQHSVIKDNINKYITSLGEKEILSEKLNKNIEEKNILSEYVTMLHSNNLPYKVMKHSMDKVLIVVNNILNDVCDFTVGLECTETPTKNDSSVIRKKLRIIINQGSGLSTIQINSSIGSGFQKFIIDIAFRIAFIKCIPSLPKFLIIDEGFGSLDNTNRELAKNALSKIAYDKKYIDFILIISHQDEFNNISQSNIEIKQIPDKDKNSGRFYSQVQFGSNITPMKCIDKADYKEPNNNDEQIDEGLIEFEEKNMIYDVKKTLFHCLICRPNKPYVCTKNNIQSIRNDHITKCNSHKSKLKIAYQKFLNKN